ncbi:MarR family transcriptional regulator [Sphingomonas sp. JC676]|uniref:MarR family winged helix-turn-helix transcriptional regulator n=1 Tax=Sphingomonas sp. JC676 TaxID=2768065 RepID=UPI0016578AEA|nr:MarR family transcriptional regulator [Sphingomonas sp. JC676]MBC9033795.1 MarR family transcriptional regulator [Sphingomonas sp. JC676]
MAAAEELTDDDYVALAGFRHALRQFLAFSEGRAAERGLTPQQHQALLAIRGAVGAPVSVGYVADRLILKPHSATGLVDRLEALDLVTRKPSPDDRRQALLALTPKAEALLGQLSATHREEIKRLRPMLTELLDRLG